MRFTVLPSAVLGLALTLAACQSDVTAPASTSDQALQAAATPVDRPFGGTCNSVFTLYDLVFLPPPNETILVSAKNHSVGTCQFTHLGRSTLVVDQDIDFTVFPAHIVGAIVITAANGDQLYGQQLADVGAPDATGAFASNGVWTWTGGTGRFANASGTVPEASTGSVVDNTVATTISGGRISY